MNEENGEKIHTREKMQSWREKTTLEKITAIYKTKEYIGKKEKNMGRKQKH